ncbi:MAG: ATP-binding protein [Desulfobacterales bacterium]|nr:ATP-binding protein [Desulfobacterales bacterium]
MKLSIRWAVILGCILLIWGTQMFIMPFTIVSSKKVMLGHTRDIMENIIDLTLEETRNYFGVARGAAHLTERLIRSDIVSTDEQRIEKLERYFYDQLEIYSQFAGIYFATPSGHFYYVNREADPDKGAFRYKQIEYDDTGRKITRFTWRDKNKQVLAEKTDFQDTYDPRKRPWYIKATREKSIIWTDPYIFFSSQKPGITSAGPLYDNEGKLQGVVGVDIELDVLSEFVGKLRVGKTGLAFIINQNEDVIAFPDVTRLRYREQAGEKSVRLPKLDELENAVCSLAYEAVKDRLESVRSSDGTTEGTIEEIRPAFASFEAGEKTYYTMFTRVKADKIFWMVGVYIPEDDYLGAILANQRRTLLLTLAASILATVCGLYVAGKITRPISALDRQARRIKKNDWSSRPRIFSVFKEIQRTANSFDEMKNAVMTYERELKEKEAIHRAITETANEAIVMVDGSGRVAFWNSAAGDLFGFGAREAVGRHIRELTPFQRQFDDADVTLYTLFKGTYPFVPLKTVELMIRARSGKEVPAEVSMVGITLEDKQYAIAVIRDISLRRRSEREKLAIWQQLQQAQKVEAIGTLAGGIAHDFNNILSGIIGHAELLQTELDGNTEAEIHAEGIISAGERARDLVRQILAFSFQENHKLALVSLTEIIEEACNLMASSLPKSIVIEREIDNSCPPVSADSTQIHQVALNLMTNAFHAMEENGGRLTVGLAHRELVEEALLEEMDLTPGHYICYSVTDTGVGISSDAMDRIFDPYFTTKPEGKGTGLGLAVIKGIVQNHGGGIHVESLPGQGSCFKVFLPAAEEGEQAKPTAAGPARVRKGSERILLVDDQKTVINVERQILELLGYRVTSRLSGKEALEVFTASPDRFDLVATDMSMPEMTGDILAGKLLEIRPDLPIILLTGYSESIGRERALELGFRDLLMKPVRLRELSAAIRQTLDYQKMLK